MIAYLRQARALHRWMQTVAEPGATLALEFPVFGWRITVIVSLIRGRANPASSEPSFLIRIPSQAARPTAGWAPIFVGAEVEAFERVPGGESGSIRWGLDGRERETALAIARSSIEASVTSGGTIDAEDISNLPARFLRTASAGVAVWCGGAVRGSQIVESRPLARAIAEAARRAARDARFQPVTADELSSIRIQITLLHPFRMPIGLSKKLHILDAEKGYLLRALPVHRAYFLPEVFNTRAFSTFAEFEQALLRKARLEPGATNDYEIVMFEVDDFIESSNLRSAIKLRGPEPNPRYFPTMDRAYIERRARMAADWLLAIQGPDGFLLLAIDPLRATPAVRFDPRRAAFTGFALAEFGRAVREPRYCESANRLFIYLTGRVLPEHRSDTLLISYAARLASALGYPASGFSALLRIPDHEYRRMDTLVLLQVAATLKDDSTRDPASGKAFERCAVIIRERWREVESRRSSIATAVWAEAINVLSGPYQELADTIALHIIEHQLPSGAFSGTTGSAFAYTRGTGKVFESLSIAPARYQDALTKSAGWLFSMQYDDESAYFIEPRVRPLVIGGFRHDDFNHECWIDAAGHVLLGSARIVLFSNWHSGTAECG